METVGILKSTRFTTRKEKDGDKVYEVNVATIQTEVVLDGLNDDDLRFLAVKQGQAVTIELGLTHRSPSGPPRSGQLTIPDEAQKATEVIPPFEPPAPDPDDDPEDVGMEEEVRQIDMEPDPEPAPPLDYDPFANEDAAPVPPTTKGLPWAAEHPFPPPPPPEVVPELPALSSYIRAGDVIVRREEKRITGVEPRQIPVLAKTTNGIRTQGGETSAAALDEGYRLILCRNTLKAGDELMDAVGRLVHVVKMKVNDVELSHNNGTIAEFKVTWADLDSEYRMHQRA